MVQRAEREPTMEEIVVALRETKRTADRLLPVAVSGPPPRGRRGLRMVDGPSDLTDLRDTEIERLLSENARLNARIVSLLKVIEQDQAYHEEVAAQAEKEAAPVEMDASAIQHEVRAALEAELRPFLLVLLRLLQKRSADNGANGGSAGPQAGPQAEATPSEWIVDIMQKLDAKAPAPAETIVDGNPAPRRPRLRQCMADILSAFGLEQRAAAARQRITSPDERT
jgi:hypothetical protein